AGYIPLSPCRHGSEIQLGAEVTVAAFVTSVLLPGQRLVVQPVLPYQRQLQAPALRELKLLLYTRAQAHVAPLVQMVCTIVDQAGAYLPRPFPQPGGTAGVSGGQPLVILAGGIEGDISIGQTQPIHAAERPVQFTFGALEADAGAVVGQEVVQFEIGRAHV